MPTTDVISRVAQWLESLWTDPAAAAEFAESPATSLANFNLSQSDLDGVDLRSVAGGLGGSAGVSPAGRETLTQFAQSPSSHGGGHGGGDGGHSQVHDVAQVTQRVHHDNPQVVKVFNDNSQTFNIDNSQTFVNTGTISGDISIDNDTTTNVANKGGIVASQNSGDVVAGSNGSNVAGEGLSQVKAQDSTVLQNSGTGAGGEDDGRGPIDQQGQQVPGNDEDQNDGEREDDGHNGQQPDLPFGKGDTGEQDEDLSARHDDKHESESGDESQDEDQGQDRDDQSQESEPDGGEDPTAAAKDLTSQESQDDADEGQHFKPGFEDHDDADADHDPGHEALLHT